MHVSSPAPSHTLAQVRLTAFNTPYGDTQLDPVGIADDVRQRAVWSQLEERMKKGLPVKVGEGGGAL